MVLLFILIYISYAIKSILTETENYFLYSIQCIIPWASYVSLWPSVIYSWFSLVFFLLQVLKIKAVPGNFIPATMIMIIYFFYIIYFLIRFLKKLIVLLVTYLWLVSFGWPEKTIATCSSTLAWKIPWAEEPGWLQSMGSLRVGHTWATSLSLSCIGEGNGNPLQCSCLENPRYRGAWWAAIYGVAQSRTRLKWLSSSSSSFGWMLQTNIRY